MTKTWWEAPMGGSVLSFLKAEWKVSDTGSAHWASSFSTNFDRFFLYVPNETLQVLFNSRFHELTISLIYGFLDTCMKG
jgi:hypothetical protein